MTILESIVISMPMVYGLLAAWVLGIVFGWWVRPRIESVVTIIFHDDTQPGRS